MFNVFQFIVKLLFGNSATGKLTISSTISQMEIKTGWTPKHVFVSLDNNCGMEACGSHQDWFDVKIVNMGFIIHCNVKSSFRKITWIATQ